MFGDALCRTLFAFFAVPMYMSTLMILFIAVDRYRRVVWRRSLSRCAAKALIVTKALIIAKALVVTKALIVAGVAASTAFGVPVVAVSSLHELDHAELAIHRRYCVEEWPDDALRLGYALLTFAGQFGVPLTVSAALYWRIYRRLKRRRLPRGRLANNRRSVT